MQTSYSCLQILISTSKLLRKAYLATYNVIYTIQVVIGTVLNEQLQTQILNSVLNTHCMLNETAHPPHSNHYNTPAGDRQFVPSSGEPAINFRYARIESCETLNEMLVGSSSLVLQRLVASACVADSNTVVL